MMAVGPWGDAYEHSSCCRFPMEESQMSCSTEPFIHSIVTQKQLEMVPLRRDAQQTNPWAFISSMSACAQALFLLLSSLFLPHLCVHPPCFHHPSLLLSKRSAIPSSCCISVSMYLSGTTHLPALCYPKGWQFRASCLGLAPRAQSVLPSASLTALEQRYSSARGCLY